MPRRLLEYVLEQSLEAWLGCSLGDLDGCLEAPLHLAQDRLVAPLVPAAPGGQIVPHALNRVALHPGGERVRATVCIRVVAGRMPTHPVRERLDQSRAFASRSALDRLLYHVDDSEDVVPVDTDGRDSIGNALAANVSEAVCRSAGTLIAPPLLPQKN